MDTSCQQSSWWGQLKCFVPDYIVTVCVCVCKRERLNSEVTVKSPQQNVCVYVCVDRASIMRLTSVSRLNMPLFRHSNDDEAPVTAVCVCSLQCSYIKMSFWQVTSPWHRLSFFAAVMRKKNCILTDYVLSILLYGYTQPNICSFQLFLLLWSRCLSSGVNSSDFLLIMIKSNRVQGGVLLLQSKCCQYVGDWSLHCSCHTFLFSKVLAWPTFLNYFFQIIPLEEFVPLVLLLHVMH